MTPDERMTSLAALPFERVGAANTGAFKFWAQVKLIFQHRQMLDLLIRRDLKSRYKDSTLGFFWTLVRPLTQLAIYYVVLGKFLGAARNIPEFAIYIFAGLTLFSLFSEMVSGGTASIISNSGLVKKVYLPRELFPLASAGSALFNFAIQMVILLTATTALGSFPLSPDLIYFIPSVAVVLIYGTAFALLLSAVNVYLRDVQYLVEVVLMVLMWASPILYAWKYVADVVGPGLILTIYTNNPITLAVIGFHRSMWVAGANEPYPDHLLLRLVIAALVGLVCVVISQRIFAKLQGNFAQML